VLPKGHIGRNLGRKKGKSHFGNIIGNNNQDLLKILVTGHTLEKLKILKTLGE
jgi:hypothetical protein